jgi:hypothetical protein
MTLTNQQQVENTRAKLARLELRYKNLQTADCEDKELRAASLQSIKRYINQFKEEIARYEAVHSVGR